MKRREKWGRENREYTGRASVLASVPRKTSLRMSFE